MRAVLSAAFLAVSTHAQVASAQTNQNMANALVACEQPLTQQFQGNQYCAQQSSSITTAITGTDNTGLINFCSSNCLPLFNSGYTSMGLCMQAYIPTLTADLTRDGVANASFVAQTMSKAYMMLPEIFKLMCMRNERGDFCMTLYAHMGTDMTANGQTPNITTICNVYYNCGCCLLALDHLYQVIVPGTSFVTTLSGICPQLVNFNPPPCLSYGQSSLALSVAVPIVGLNCDVYAQQPETFKIAFELALKTDLAATGIPLDFISVKSVAAVGGVCTFTLVIRAASDTATKALEATAATINTAALTATTAQLQTVPATTTGTVTMQSPTVSEVTITGQTVGNSGSSVAPSCLLVGASVVMMWLA